MLIAILNQSTLVSNADAATMTQAVATQVRLDAAPLWDRTPAAVVFYTDPSAVPVTAHGIAIVDTIQDQPQGVLGFHTEDQGGKLWGVVAAKPELDNGKGSAYSFEVCDPVEAPSYTVGGVSVSNFVTPSWFDPLAPATAQFDKLGQLTTAFSILKGGYVVYETAGKEQQQFGAEFPEWRKEMKSGPLARTRLRLAQAHSAV